MRCAIILLLGALVAPCLNAGTDGPEAATGDDTLVVQGRTLHPKSGTVEVGDKLATIQVPPDLMFFATDDARFIMEKVNHNEPDPSIIGAVMPRGEDDWLTVLSYDPEHGHVSDSDANGMDYSALLTQMQEEARDGNSARRSAGYDTIELRGWAEPPHYDPANHQLYWAKTLHFSSMPGDTLNYCVRVLTRRGVLEMNTIGEPKNLASIAVASKDLLVKTTVKSGERYTDFDSSIDKIAVGGIAALIAGGVLAKSGFLAVIGKFLLVMIKPLLIGLAVAGGWLWKLFAGRREAKAAEEPRHR